MTNLLDYPPLVFSVSFLVLTLSVWIGKALLRRGRALEPDAREDFNVVQGATLTLLGLIVGFTFSMALTRYDQRKNYEEAEANAIGTEYIRADLLPGAAATKLRTLLQSYLHERILFYTTRHSPDARVIDSQTAKLQDDLWAAVREPALGGQQTAVVALAVSGMNDVLNSQGYTQAAWWNRIPTAAWLLMGVMAIGSNLLIGFGTRSGQSKAMLLVLPLIVSIAFLLIADIDSPGTGLIRVIPQNLFSLAKSLHAP